MEIDTGAALSLINESLFSQIASNSPLKPMTTQLSPYMGEHLPILGTAIVTVEYNSQSAELSVITRVFPSFFSFLFENFYFQTTDIQKNNKPKAE